jgi:hypothetical protein
MGSRGLGAVTAFDVLRKRARDSRRRVADIAAEILAAAGAGADHGAPGRAEAESRTGRPAEAESRTGRRADGG